MTKKDNKQVNIKINGPKSKQVVDFSPTTDDKDVGPKYVGQTPSASTLSPKSSFKNRDLPVVETVLSITNRRKRSNQMKRLSSKLTRLRAVSRNQFAPEKRLKRRAQKMIRRFLRTRFAGNRGANYSNLSPSEKIAIDKMIDQNSKTLGKRLVGRFMPIARKAESLRLQGVRTHSAPKQINKAGGLGLMPRPKLDMASFEEIRNDIIAESIGLCILEGNTERLDKLLYSGLADKNSISQYKKALSNLEYSKRNSILRDKAFDVLNKLIDVVTDDTSIYYKVKNKIQKDYEFNKRTIKESNHMKSHSDIVKKILKKYRNKLNENSPIDLSKKRDEKNIQKFHKSLTTSLGDEVKKKLDLIKSYKEAGKFEFDVGDRFHTPNTIKRNEPPYKVIGHFVNHKLVARRNAHIPTPMRHGYYVSRKLSGGEEQTMLYAHDGVTDHSKIFKKIEGIKSVKGGND
jgi:hypothetical protein